MAAKFVLDYHSIHTITFTHLTPSAINNICRTATINITSVALGNPVISRTTVGQSPPPPARTGTPEQLSPNLTLTVPRKQGISRDSDPREVIVRTPHGDDIHVLTAVAQVMMLLKTRVAAGSNKQEEHSKIANSSKAVALSPSGD